MTEIDYIDIRPDPRGLGWTLRIITSHANYEFTIGDAIQFHAETERTIGRWLADGPEDFKHANDFYATEEDDETIAETVRTRDATDTGERLSIDDLIGGDLADTLGAAADLYRDMKRGK